MIAAVARAADEVRAQAIEMDVDGLVVPVVSPAGLVLLKLVAWKQRRHIQPRKDAADIAYVLRHFSAVVTTEVMFEKHLAVIEGADYDIDVAACRVLGQEMAGMAATDSLAFVKQLLDHELREETDSALVRDVAEHMAAAGLARTCQLLQSLSTGFAEVRP
jgi:predicted nucleotidyltransferase